MNDALLLYLGMFCFGMTVLGMILTYREFRKMSHSSEPAAARGAVTNAEAVRPAAIARN